MNIEQAKDAAAKEYNFPSYGDFHFHYRSGHKKAIEAEGVIKRSYEIYGASCIEGERQRIAKKVKKHFEIYVGCPIEVEDMTPGKAYAKGRTDAIAELKQLTNK